MLKRIGSFCLDRLPDKAFLKLKYKLKTRRSLNLKNPKTYSEKLQWLKLYDHRPVYTAMVDKCEAKKLVSERLGKEYVIPTYGVWDSFDDIDFSKLPEQFVLKCTHDSGGLVICKDVTSFDKIAAKTKLEKSLKRNYYRHGREWPYKNVKPRILAEAYMEDANDGELRDYKFFTFGGVPKLLYIAQGRGREGETYADFYDMNGTHLDIEIDHHCAPQAPQLPLCFKEMQQLAEKLASDTPQLRVDFYEVGGRIYFGEMTFFHCSGFMSFTPSQWDQKLGSWVELPTKQI